MKHHTVWSGCCGSIGHRQQGMALLISLVVLLVVTILGTVAMRTALFQNRVSINSQASNLAFQAAESGLHAALNEAAKNLSSDPNQLLNVVANTSVPKRVCFDGDGLITVTNDTMPGVGGVVTHSVACAPVDNSNSVVSTVVAMPGGTVATSGTDSRYGSSHVLEIRARAEVSGTNVTAEHVQEWTKQGPAGGLNTEGG